MYRGHYCIYIPVIIPSTECDCSLTLLCVAISHGPALTRFVEYYNLLAMKYLVLDSYTHTLRSSTLHRLRARNSCPVTHGPGGASLQALPQPSQLILRVRLRNLSCWEPIPAPDTGRGYRETGNKTRHDKTGRDAWYSYVHTHTSPVQCGAST